MKLPQHVAMLAVFFWSIGSICAGPALGADGAKPDDKNAFKGWFEQASAEEMSQSDQPAGADASKARPELSTGSSADQPESAPVPATKAAGPDKKPELPKGQGVEVGSFGKIDLHVKDLKLTKVLQLLSIQGKKNIIASKNVSGTVSADLYDVDFYQALDAILRPNGYGYRKKGSFIYVYTQEELKKIQKRNRKKVHKIIQLDYINAADASGFVQPLLSPDGSISVSSQVEEGFQPSLSDGGAKSLAHTDTLVVHDYAERVKKIMDVVDKLDKRPKQVLVEATVLQARLTENNAFGVDFSLFGDLSVNNFNTPLSAVDDLITGSGANNQRLSSGQALNSTVGNTLAGDASIKAGILGDDAGVFVRALDSVTDTNVLATPKVLVLNRQKADLLVGQRLGYLSTTQTETTATQTVEFLDIGTQLTLRPFISSDGYVRLELRPQVSDGDTNRTVNGTVIPEETTQELTTNVLVESGQTVVLGGLFKEDTSVSRNQVPGLGDIPGLGAAFQGQDDSVQRSEVIFLIKPTIMKEKTLAKAGDQMHEDVTDSRLGAREGLLPWSRTKLTTSHMKQALEHKRQGKTDEALWDVNLALHLDPTMVDAMQLKEKLTGEKLKFHERSRLNDVIDTLVKKQLEAEAKNDGSEDADESSNESSDEASSSGEATKEESKAEKDVRDEAKSGQASSTPATQPSSPAGADETDADAVKAANDAQQSDTPPASDAGATRVGNFDNASQQQRVEERNPTKKPAEASGDESDGASESKADNAGKPEANAGAKQTGETSVDPAPSENAGESGAESESSDGNDAQAETGGSDQDDGKARHETADDPAWEFPADEDKTEAEGESSDASSDA